jgi:hypothetical protein
MIRSDLIDYRVGNELELDSLLDLYRASTLGERRPINDRERMARMLSNANLVISAWDGQLMVGIARALSDYSYCTYVSDLAVRVSHQRSGIGTELIRRVQSSAPETTVILLSAPKAVEYYPRIGFSRHDSAWILRAGDKIC